MTITFRLHSSAEPMSAPAVVTLQQLCQFREFAQSHGHLVGVFDDYEFHCLDEGFDARVCPWSWATLGRLFDDQESVISVIEEAQYFGLMVRFWRNAQTTEIMMGVSRTPDGSFPLHLNDQNARLLLDVIGVATASKGTIHMAQLTQAIDDAPTRRHLERNGLETYLEQLDGMARTCLSPDPQLVWQ